jgi:adenylate kinase
MPPLLPKHGDPKTCECGCKLEQRKDDTEAVVRDRLTVYKNETQPLIGFYKKLGILRDFEVKKGLDDLPKLEAMLKKELKL